MLNVSEAFKGAILAPVRRIIPRLTIGYTDPFLDQSIEASVSEVNRSNAETQVYNGKKNPFAKYLSLEPGVWKLGHGFCLAPGNGQQEIGWRGTQLSDPVTKEYTAPYPKLTVTFLSRPLEKLQVVGDSKRLEWPEDFIIRVYTDGLLVHTETVTGNDAVIWTKDIDSITQVTSLELEITKWSHAERFVKIVEFFTSIQEVYEGDDILSINLTEERDVSGGSLPIGNISSNEIKIQLNNIDRKFDAGNVGSPLYELLRPNRRLKAELGLVLPDSTVEFVPLFQGWTQNWQVPESEVWASTTARDRLEMLRKSTFSTSEVYQDVTLYDLAEIVLQDAGLNALEYTIDEKLLGFMIPYAWFQPVSHRDALRQIVAACLGQAYCDRLGVIRIEGPSFLSDERTESQLEITAADYFKKDNPILWSEVANVIEVDVAPLRPDVEEEVYADPESRTEDGVITVFYPEVPVIDAVATVEGAELNSVTYYAWGATLDITGVDFRIIIDGKVLRPSGGGKIIAQDSNSIIDNGRLVYSVPYNPLIQTQDMGQLIANTLLIFADPRRDITLDWRGHLALELADRITAPDFTDVSTRDYHVINQTLRYDGGLRAKLTGRRVP